MDPPGTQDSRPSPFRPRDSEPPVDAAYVRRIAARTLLLQQQSARTREDIRRTRRELARVQDDLRRELVLLRDEIAALERDTGQVVRRVEGAVAGFRRLVRAGDFSRLRERVEALDPERRVTAEQLRAMVRDARQ